MTTKIYLYPSKLRRTGGAGFFVTRKVDILGKVYTQGFERYNGPVTEVIEQHEVPCSEKLHQAMCEEARRNFERYEKVIGQENPEQDDETMRQLGIWFGSNVEYCQCSYPGTDSVTAHNGTCSTCGLPVRGYD